ncbi:MAG TPA: GNAT family N-acetyltransferase [Deltaproteobacteria bacterium]|nr:GNAT family N-acetyltransferase [Deltaproteobacteria bacterium]
MITRPFEPEDAEFCFKTRAEAYIVKFRDELEPEIIAECVNAFMPDDYVQMAGKQPFFIVTEEDERMAFFTFKQLNIRSAELPLLFVKLTQLKRGIGKYCIQFMDEWIVAHWPEAQELIVDTIIPKYNSGFYESVGFVQKGEAFCHFPNRKVRALRMIKPLNAAGESG